MNLATFISLSPKNTSREIIDHIVDVLTSGKPNHDPQNYMPLLRGGWWTLSSVNAVQLNVKQKIRAATPIIDDFIYNKYDTDIDDGSSIALYNSLMASALRRKDVKLYKVGFQETYRKQFMSNVVHNVQQIDHEIEHLQKKRLQLMESIDNG